MTERWTEQKYSGSYEQIATVILRHSANPLLDVTAFYELILFSLPTGNADMHLKNFSLCSTAGAGCHLAPACDLVCTAVANPSDEEELAFTLNGKKRMIKRVDLEKAMISSGIPLESVGGIFQRFGKKHLPFMLDFIGNSFLPADQKKALSRLLEIRAGSLLMA